MDRKMVSSFAARRETPYDPLSIIFLIDNHRLSVELAALAGIAARRTDVGARSG
jgi:hypothetical protein